MEAEAKMEAERKVEEIKAKMEAEAKVEAEIKDHAETDVNAEAEIKAKFTDDDWVIEDGDCDNKVLRDHINRCIEMYDTDTQELKKRIAKLEYEVELEKETTASYAQLLKLIQFTNSELEQKLKDAEQRAEKAEEAQIRLLESDSMLDELSTLMERIANRK